MIDATDLEFMQVVDDTNAVVDRIFDYYEKRGFAQGATEREQLLYL